MPSQFFQSHSVPVVGLRLSDFHSLAARTLNFSASSHIKAFLILVQAKKSSDTFCNTGFATSSCGMWWILYSVCHLRHILVLFLELLKSFHSFAPFVIEQWSANRPPALADAPTTFKIVDNPAVTLCRDLKGMAHTWVCNEIHGFFERCRMLLTVGLWTHHSVWDVVWNPTEIQHSSLWSAVCTLKEDPHTENPQVTIVKWLNVVFHGFILKI